MTCSVISLLFFALSDVDNGCQEHYEPAGNLCIRASIFPETYENAQSRCQSDGGYLLSITSSEIQVLKIKKECKYDNQIWVIPSMYYVFIAMLTIPYRKKLARLSMPRKQQLLDLMAIITCG